MLYLAEVQKKSGGLLSSSKAVGLKLLAQQRSEDRWQVLANGDVLNSDQVGDFGPGTLVLVDVSDKSGKVQRVKESTRTILNSLQNISRFQDRLKDQEEEIEQWKQSLTYQSQELNRREMEMESRRDQMHQLETEMARLEKEKQEALSLREEAQHLRTELDNRDRELKQAWDQLRSEQDDLNRRLADTAGNAGLSADQLTHLQDRLGRLSEAVVSGEEVRSQLHHALESLGHQKAIVAEHWGQWEQHQSTATQNQNAVSQLAETVADRWQVWQDGQANLERARAGLESLQALLQSYQDHAQTLQGQIAAQAELHQQLTCAVGGMDPSIAQQVDVTTLEAMQLNELEKLVQDLEKDYKKTYNFVNDQEDELRLLSQDIEAKKAEIEGAGEFDRLNLENELADLNSEYQLFDESVVPQRKRLREAQAILAAHQSVLSKRKGIPLEGEPQQLDLSPVLDQIIAQQQSYEGALTTLNGQIAEVQGQIQAQEGEVATLEASQQQARQEIEAMETDLRQQQANLAQLWGKLNTYEELLQPTHETLNALEQQLHGLQQEVDRVQEMGGYQAQLLAEMNQSLTELAA
ncbi:MAG: pilus motility taxis protein HmpF [Prochlorothrix sp.]